MIEAILGLQEYAEKSSKKHIITTAIEHKAVLEPLSFLEAKGFEVTYIKPDISGRINPDEVLSNVRDDQRLAFQFYSRCHLRKVHTEMDTHKHKSPICAE